MSETWKQIDAVITKMANMISAVNSDTDPAEEIVAKVNRIPSVFRSTPPFIDIPDKLEELIWHNVLYDNFMVDTDIQRKRRMSGEFDKYFQKAA